MNEEYERALSIISNAKKNLIEILINTDDCRMVGNKNMHHGISDVIEVLGEVGHDIGFSIYSIKEGVLDVLEETDDFYIKFDDGTRSENLVDHDWLELLIKDIWITGEIIIPDGGTAFFHEADWPSLSKGMKVRTSSNKSK